MRLSLPRLLGLFAILATAVLGSAASANAATINVCQFCADVPPTQFDTIQEAVNAAKRSTSAPALSHRPSSTDRSP